MSFRYNDEIPLQEYIAVDWVCLRYESRFDDLTFWGCMTCALSVAEVHELQNTEP
ncbi:hypothetical protein ACWGOQ_0018100 [Aquimarina sp. M1]